jgi:hypothetical protein
MRKGNESKSALVEKEREEKKKRIARERGKERTRLRMNFVVLMTALLSMALYSGKS